MVNIVIFYKYVTVAKCLCHQIFENQNCTITTSKKKVKAYFKKNFGPKFVLEKIREKYRNFAKNTVHQPKLPYIITCEKNPKIDPNPPKPYRTARLREKSVSTVRAYSTAPLVRMDLFSAQQLV
jgi:hypothetical protein